LGNQLKTLFDKDGLTREGSSVIGTVLRHLAWLDSDLAAKAVASSTFRIEELKKPATTLYVQIPPDMLDAQKGLLRCWFATFIRVLGQVGDEREVLFLIDEASACGGLNAIEEALVRGRSGGLRLFLVYQSDSQVLAAFRDKRTLLYDNTSIQIYLGASGYETAERISKCLGEYTQVVNSFTSNSGRSWQGAGMSGQGGTSYSYGETRSYSVSGRALLKPEEVLQLDPAYLIAFVRGLRPILARRILYYSDPFFCGEKEPARSIPRWWGLMACAIGLILLGLMIKIKGG
jgi:type IV secretion system protein VirD4